MLTKKLLAALRKPPGEILGYGVILVRNALGMTTRLPTPDRQILEEVILPAYAQRADINKVLFVGCEWFTRHYANMFRDKEYWTIDPDAWKRKFGASNHVVARLEQLDEHFPQGFFDLIICNGVYGWGLNDRDDCELAFAKCFHCLRDSVSFLLGWNDLPERRPVPLGELRSLARFSPYPFEGLGACQYLADPEHRHIFNFYVKNV